MQILLAEDNQDDIFLIELVVKELNINESLTITRDGKTTIDLLNNLAKENGKLPELILLDINLPKMTGLEVLKHIKTQKSTKHIPVAIFTSSSLDSDMNCCYEHGADLYIRKPNDIVEFKKAMLHAIQLAKKLKNKVC